MAPAPKATRSEIERLMHIFGGNVGAVAEAAGLHVSVLYRKFKRWGTDAGFYREQQRMYGADGARTITTIGTPRLAFGVSSLSPISHIAPTISETTDADAFACPDDEGRPSLNGMERGATAQVIGMTVRPREQKAPSFTREEAEAVADFRIRYQAMLGFETNNSAVFHQYFADTFPAWAEK